MSVTGTTAPVAPKIRITDSTLRDGSHAMAHRFTEEQVRGVVHALDGAGVEVIEVTHGDGLGGSMCAIIRVTETRNVRPEETRRPQALFRPATSHSPASSSPR